MTKVAPNKSYLILAGSFEEFRQWCAAHRFYCTNGGYKGQSPEQLGDRAFYISCPRDLYGLTRVDTEVRLVGNYYRNRLYNSVELSYFQRRIELLKQFEEEEVELPKIRFIRV